jgi:hypothetical protein
LQQHSPQKLGVFFWRASERNIDDTELYLDDIANTIADLVAMT